MSEHLTVTLRQVLMKTYSYRLLWQDYTENIHSDSPKVVRMLLHLVIYYDLVEHPLLLS